MLEYNYSMQIAKDVLDGVIQEGNLTNLYGSIEAYQNGREQGYSIVVENAVLRLYMISFAQFEKSDDIVIYTGLYTGCAITDEAYNNAKFFKHDNIFGAVDYIVKKIIEISNSIVDRI